jgi:nucleotide-binding universal stress UspA family protein
METSVKTGSVMVGVDGSSGSDAAVVWAAAYAAAHRRPLAIVHGTGAPVVTDFGFDLDDAGEGLRAAGLRVTERARDLAVATSPAVDVVVHVEVREPRSVLIEQASEAHLLVLGSRGHGVVLSLLLGSVSVALAALAACPVIVVRPSGTGASQPVVVGVDGTDDSSDALTFAFELAAEQHRPLHVVHAAGQSWLLPAPAFAGPSAELISADWQLLLAESVAGFGEKFPDVVFTSQVVSGSAAGSLVAASEHASTVVVGARGRSALTKRLLGSVSRSVVEHARCTVAVVRARS